MKPPTFNPIDERALRSVAAQFFVNGALFASFIPRLPEIRDRVGISVGGVGVLLSIAGISGLIGSAIVAFAIGRLGTRTVILASSTLVSVSLAVVGFATTPVVLLVGLAGMVTFDVLVDVAMNMQGSWLSARRHMSVMNRLHGLWSLGALIGGVASSQIAAAGVSLSAHLVISAVVLFAVLGYVAPGLPRIDEIPAQTDHARKPTLANRPVSSPRVVIALFGFIGFFALTMESTSIDWAAFRFSDDFNTSAGFAALGYVAVTAGMTIARFAGDWVSSRTGQPQLFLMSLALASIGLSLASFGPVQYLALAGYGLTGLGIATLFPTLYDIAAQHPGRPGAGLGALTAGLRTANLTIPILVGGLAGTNLTVGTAVAVVTLPSALGFLVILRKLRPT